MSAGSVYRLGHHKPGDMLQSTLAWDFQGMKVKGLHIEVLFHMC